MNDNYLEDYDNKIASLKATFMELGQYLGDIDFRIKYLEARRAEYVKYRDQKIVHFNKNRRQA